MLFKLKLFFILSMIKVSLFSFVALFFVVEFGIQYDVCDLLKESFFVFFRSIFCCNKICNKLCHKLTNKKGKTMPTFSMESWCKTVVGLVN